MSKERVIVVIDGQAGSCGKGKIAGYLALKEKVDAAVTNAMPNSGHVFEDEKGNKKIFRNIPVSSVNKETLLFMGAGSAIDMAVLKKEYEENADILKGREIIVHPRVPLIEERHKKLEKEKIRSGSTFKGGGACLAEKVMRDERLKYFDKFGNIKSDEEYIKKINKVLENGGTLLIEGSQGCDLDLNNGTDYPHVTSRQCSVAQMVADSGIPISAVSDIIMVIRPYPIRISNKTELGKIISSGKYGEAKEIKWKEINSRSRADLDDIDFTETTTVTKKTRRVFELDIERLKNNILINRPTEIAFNFFEHLNADYFGEKGNYNDVYITRYEREYINWLECELNVPITMLGTGPKNDEIIIRNKS